MISTDDFSLMCQALPFLNLIPAGEKARVRSRSRIVDLRAGEAVRDRKGGIDSVFVVKSGAVRVYTQSAASEEQLLLYYVPPGAPCIMAATRLCLSSSLDYCIHAVARTRILALDEKTIMDYIAEKYPQLKPLYDEIYNRHDRTYFEALEQKAKEMAQKYDCPFVDNEMPYGRVPKGHPVIVDYFYHEEVRGSGNTGKRNKPSNL